MPGAARICQVMSKTREEASFRRSCANGGLFTLAILVVTQLFDEDRPQKVRQRCRVPEKCKRSLHMNRDDPLRRGMYRATVL